MSEHQDHSEDMQDINNLYNASKDEQSPPELDREILATARKADHIDSTEEQNNKSGTTRRFDPPVAIAAMLLLTIGLVTLVQQDLDQPEVFEPYAAAESDTRWAAAPKAAKQDKPLQEEQLVTSDASGFTGKLTADTTVDNLSTDLNKTLESKEDVRDRPISPSVGRLSEPTISAEGSPPPAPLISSSQAPAGMKAEIHQSEEPMLRQNIAEAIPLAATEKNKSEPIPLAAMDADKLEVAASRMTESENDIQEQPLKKAVASREQALAMSRRAPAIKRVTPDKGQVRQLTGELEVWYDENYRWISTDEFFALELKRLDGPTYGKTSKYPPYESVKEWQTLVEILPDGRSCTMVFFHERWRRLADVLALDERLRNHGGCANVFKTN